MGCGFPGPGLRGFPCSSRLWLPCSYCFIFARRMLRVARSNRCNGHGAPSAHMSQIVYEAEFTEHAHPATDQRAEGENHGQGLPAQLLLPPEQVENAGSDQDEEHGNRREG